MTATVMRADARSLPLPDASVDLVVTSPPYFALRSYQDGGEHYSGQIGSEPTPGEFLDALIACTREMMRVLKPSGSIWVNLGDKYAGGGGQWDKDERPDPGRRRAVSGKIGSGGKTYGFAAKSLMGLPWRYALRCIDELGLILRAEVIWSKPNGLPESVTDRVRRSHEQWFHMVKRPRYYAAVDTIREPQTTAVPSVGQGRISGNGVRHRQFASHPDDYNPLGKLPGSVWSIPSQPLSIPEWVGVDHFAAFPMEWPRRLILGWSPSGICGGCGEGRRPVSESTKITSRPGFNVRDQRMPGRHASGNQGREGRAGDYLTTLTGEVCACTDLTAPTQPAVILDPFGGTGTVALLADVLGRHGVSVDMSADYCRAATWRINDPGERARAMQVEKPKPVPEGQMGLFEGVL